MGIKILGDGTFLVTARIVNKHEKKSFMDYKKFQDKFEHFHAKVVNLRHFLGEIDFLKLN